MAVFTEQQISECTIIRCDYKTGDNYSYHIIEVIDGDGFTYIWPEYSLAQAYTEAEFDAAVNATLSATTKLEIV